jgi:hypothetical protein
VEVSVRGHGWIRLLLFACALAALPVLSASAADVLFPRPLHLTREVHDSVSGTTTTVEQYCYGNRVVTVNGANTSIVDYGRGELTEIDRDAGTFSVTRFDDVARALRVTGAPAGETPAQQQSGSGSGWELRSSGDSVEAQLRSDEGTRKARVVVNPAVTISKDALDVLIGAAYPNARKAEDRVVVDASRLRAVSAQSSDSRAGAAAHALPVEQHFEVTMDGARAEHSDVVKRIGDELAPAEAVAIPPGAKLVESRLLTRMRALETVLGGKQ